MAPLGYVPKPGDVALVRNPGWRAGAIRIGTRSPVDHACEVSAVTPDGKVWIVEARPGGAREVPFHYDLAHVRWVAFPGNDAQRTLAVASARSMVKAPYGWLDIIALSLAAFGLPSGWAQHRLEKSRHRICSQLCAVSWRASGVNVVAPDKPVAAVTPADWLVYDDGL